MNTMNNTSSCLALTVRKEHRLIAVSNVVRKTALISTKVVLALITLSFVNLFI